MSGRPRLEEEAELDAQAERLVAEYTAGGATIRELAERHGISYYQCQRRIERGRRNRAEDRANEAPQAIELRLLRAEVAKLRRIVEDVRRAVQ